MKKIVIDINILMDFLFKRSGHEKVAEIFVYCVTGILKGFICAHEMTTLYYFLNKSIKDKNKIRKSLSGIMNKFNIIEINDEILKFSLHSEIDDYEDAVIEVSASKNNIDYIITNNIRDFKKSIIKAISPDELIAIIKNVDLNKKNSIS